MMMKTMSKEKKGDEEGIKKRERERKTKHTKDKWSYFFFYFVSLLFHFDERIPFVCLSFYSFYSFNPLTSCVWFKQLQQYFLSVSFNTTMILVSLSLLRWFSLFLLLFACDVKDRQKKTKHRQTVWGTKDLQTELWGREANDSPKVRVKGAKRMKHRQTSSLWEKRRQSLA